MTDSDRQSLLWPPASDSDSDAEFHGDQITKIVDFSNHPEICPLLPLLQSTAVEGNSEVVNHYMTYWTPVPAIISDDRDRRLNLWSSASEINAVLENVGERTRSKISLGNQNRPLVQSPESDTDSDVEAQGELRRDRSSEVKTQGNGMHETHEFCEPSGMGGTEMRSWVESHDARRQTGHLSAMLPSVPSDGDADIETAPRERRKVAERVVERQEPSLTLNQTQLQRRPSIALQVSERVPPEWALLLLGCLLGMSTGISVVVFNKGVHVIHDLAWAGTPHEGAAWLRAQRLSDTWHRILLIPVVGGVVVGMFHAVHGIVDLVQVSRPQSSGRKIDWLAALKPVIKAVQAAVTLGTGCSLGPEGPSVDIGKSWAHGYSEIMKNSRERRIALAAAGAAAGIASGFNAPVAGTFFAIETVLRPQHAENSPPLTTAMIILAAVISSTVSQVLLGERPAFTVPPYELRSAAELPLYILLGGICGIMSVIFTRLVAWFTRFFDFLKDRVGIPISVTPAIGGLWVGIIALQYPGVLYWGFTNVDEILKTGFTALAPGQALLAQLTVAKIVATALCKGSGLVGGLYAPSLFIGSAGGAVYGSIVGKAINAALPGHDAVAHPQAYALVGMAALLAAVCSVPLTSVLLLFELTKDYHILLPLMGAVGLAIWVAAVGNQKRPAPRDTSGILDPDGAPLNVLQSGCVWRRKGTSGMEVKLCTLDSFNDLEDIYISDDTLMEECTVAQSMSKVCVKVQAMATVKETIGVILAARQRFALIVDENDLLEGIVTFSDLQREVLRVAEESVFLEEPSMLEVDTMLVAAICSGKGANKGDNTDLVVCFPDMNLRRAEELMRAHEHRQLPVVTHGGKQWQNQGCKLVGVLDRNLIRHCVKTEAAKRIGFAACYEGQGGQLQAYIWWTLIRTVSLVARATPTHLIATHLS